MQINVFRLQQDGIAQAFPSQSHHRHFQIIASSFMNRPHRKFGKLHLLVVFWIAGILFPMFGFSRLTPQSAAVFDWLFKTPAAHVLMHLLLYAVLSAMLMSIMQKTASGFQKVTLPAFLLTTVVAIAQEFIQLGGQLQRVSTDEWFDWTIDVLGALIGCMAIGCLRARTKTST